MEIKCVKTPTTGVQIFVDGEYLTSFSYHPNCDELISLLENAQYYKDEIESKLICPECDNPYPHTTTEGNHYCEECGHEW